MRRDGLGWAVGEFRRAWRECRNRPADEGRKPLTRCIGQCRSSFVSFKRVLHAAARQRHAVWLSSPGRLFWNPDSSATRVRARLSLAQHQHILASFPKCISAVNSFHDCGNTRSDHVMDCLLRTPLLERWPPVKANGDSRLQRLATVERCSAVRSILPCPG